MDRMSGSHASTKRRRIGRRAIWWGVAGLAALVLACVAWVGVRGFLAKEALERAVPVASDIADAIASGAVDRATTASSRLTDDVDTAHALTSDPVWRAAELVPAAGPNLTAFREAASIAHDVVHDAVEPLGAIATRLDVSTLRPVDGAVDLEPLSGIQEPVRAAADALASAAERSERIDTDAVIGPVRSGVERLRGAVEKASIQLSAVSRVVQLLPAMLGQDGPRRYLLLVQNPAELRALGGISGAVALVEADGGRLSLLQQASSSDFGRFDPPVMELAPETTALYGDIPARYIQNVTQTPSFPLAGELAARMWAQRFGGEVDGVVSLDPVALASLLAATGPVTLPTGDRLTADDAVQLLLSDVYARYPDPAAQDAFFAAAAAAVFDRVSAGEPDPRALIDALGRAGEQRRIQVWSADPAEQELVAETTLAGELPVSDPETKRFGVYLNDATGAKMDYYLDVQLAAGTGSCRADGAQSYVVSVTLTNTAPADASTSLPAYVTGGGAFGVAPGSVKTQVNVYGAEGTSPTRVHRDGQDAGFTPASDAGRSVAEVWTELAPGQSTTLEFAFLGSDPFDGDIELAGTPTVHELETRTLTENCRSGLW